MSQQAITDASTLSWDLATNNIAILTATVGIGNTRTLTNATISSGSNGENYQLTFIQDGVGGRSILFDTNFKVVGSFDQDPNKRTLITVVPQDGQADVLLTPMINLDSDPLKVESFVASHNQTSVTVVNNAVIDDGLWSVQVGSMLLNSTTGITAFTNGGITINFATGEITFLSALQGGAQVIIKYN